MLGGWVAVGCASNTSGGSATPAAADGGAKPDTGAVTTGGTGGASKLDCAALPLPSNMDDIIATFEMGTGAVLQAGGRGGGFYMFNDGTGTQTPPPGMLPPAKPTDRCGSTYALCMSGKDFTMWGAGMGTDLAPTTGDAGTGNKQTYDASMYKGIAFWAKSNTSTGAALRVSLKDKNTAPEGKQCDAMAKTGATACNDDWGKGITLTSEWQPYIIKFSDLAQAGWGKASTAFDDKAVYSIQYQVSQGIDFDLCIDDLVFTH
jgi:hypothetical protein